MNYIHFFSVELPDFMARNNQVSQSLGFGSERYWFWTVDEIAEQTGRKIESLRSLLCNSKRFNKTTKTYMIELEDDKRYKLKFKQSFTIDELNLKGIGWLLESPLVEVEEVEE